MRLAPQPQASLYETTIENAPLEAALEERETLKARNATARKKYKDADDRAKTLAGELDLDDDTPTRVGRFLLTRTAVAARSVSFDTDPTSRLTIRTIEP
jgi:hypothetical protein